MNFLRNAPQPAENSRAKFTRCSTPPGKFTRKIHATDVSRMHFAWENGTLKLQVGPGPPHGENPREKFTRRSTPIWDPVFDPHFRAQFQASREHCSKNSREKFTRRIGALMRPIFDHLWALFFGLSWQVALVSHVKSKSTPLPRHAPNGPQLDTRHPADW